MPGKVIEVLVLGIALALSPTPEARNYRKMTLVRSRDAATGQTTLRTGFGTIHSILRDEHGRPTLGEWSLSAVQSRDKKTFVAHLKLRRAAHAYSLPKPPADKQLTLIMGENAATLDNDDSNFVLGYGEGRDLSYEILSYQISADLLRALGKADVAEGWLGQRSFTLDKAQKALIRAFLRHLEK